MKIQCAFSPNHPYIQIQICSSTRKLFGRMAARLRTFMRKPDVQTMLEADAEMHSKWQDGLSAIEKLAYIPSRILHLTPKEAADALNLLCYYSFLEEKPSTQTRTVVFGLALILPVWIPRLPLPERPQAWGVIEPDPTVAQLYARLRSGPPEEEPFLLLLEAFMLGAILSGQSHSEAAVLTLSDHLDKATKSMQITLGKLHEKSGKMSGKKGPGKT